MRWRSAAGLALATLLVFATGGPTSFAENDDRLRYPLLRPYYGPEPPQAQPRRQRTRQPVPQPYYRQPPQPEQPAFYTPWGPVYRSTPAQPAPEELNAPPGEQRLRRARDKGGSERKETVRRRAPQVSPPAPEAPEKAAQQPAVEPSTSIVVFGDSLAALVGDGLDEIFEDNPDVEIVNKARVNTGLVRNDYYDWPKAIEEFLKGGERISLGVVMVGSNDRQALRDGDASLEPLSDRWRALYRDRVDAIVRAFAERRVPLVWVGAPPMKNERLSTDLIAMNEIYRERVQRGGGVYVDIWQGFVDDENQYAATGPDVSGQVARLRTGDGVHFTRAGARKAAHFADVEVKHLIEKLRPGSAVATSPGEAAADPAARAAAIERLIDAAIPDLPQPPGLGTLAARPVAGPVLPLTRTDIAPGGVLLARRPPLDNDASYLNESVLIRGVVPAPRPGRADDFRWPRP